MNEIETWPGVLAGYDIAGLYHAHFALRIMPMQYFPCDRKEPRGRQLSWSRLSEQERLHCRAVADMKAPAHKAGASQEPMSAATALEAGDRPASTGHNRGAVRSLRAEGNSP